MSRNEYAVFQNCATTRLIEKTMAVKAIIPAAIAPSSCSAAEFSIASTDSIGWLRSIRDRTSGEQDREHHVGARDDPAVLAHPALPSQPGHCCRFRGRPVTPAARRFRRPRDEFQGRRATDSKGGST